MIAQLCKPMHIQGGIDETSKQEFGFGMVSLFSVCFSGSCIFLSWKIIFFQCMWFKVSLETSSSEARRGKQRQYVLHDDRKNLPRNGVVGGVM